MRFRFLNWWAPNRFSSLLMTGGTESVSDSRARRIWTRGRFVRFLISRFPRANVEQKPRKSSTITENPRVDRSTLHFTEAHLMLPPIHNIVSLHLHLPSRYDPFNLSVHVASLSPLLYKSITATDNRCNKQRRQRERERERERFCSTKSRAVVEQRRRGRRETVWERRKTNSCRHWWMP